MARGRRKGVDAEVLLLLVASLAVPSLASINFPELRDVVYEVSISEVPDGFGAFKLDEQLVANGQYSGPLPSSAKVDESDPQSMLVWSEYGQQFVCSIPTPPKPPVEDGPPQPLTASVVADIVSASFYVQNCIRRSMGWWTYELCHEKHIKQYHVEGNEIIGDVIALGYYYNNSELPSLPPKTDQQLYFEQRYPGGTVCDLTGKPRNAHVRYYCDEALETNEAYLEVVEEASSCEYLLRVRVGSLCKLPAFLPTDKPSPSLGIVCRPLLDANKAQAYVTELIDARNRKAAAKARMELLLQRAESTQRQRYARSRFAYDSVKKSVRWKAKDRALKHSFEADVREASQISFAAEGKKGGDIHFVFDDFTDMKNQYKSEEDEDLGNIYWFLKDPFWDRSFYPATAAHVRATNKYFNAMNRLWKQFRYARGTKMKPLTKFLQNIEDGLVDEINLGLIFGVFEGLHDEDTLPTVDVDEAAELAFWSDVDVQKERARRFEDSVTGALSRGVALSSNVVLSGVARRILAIRTSLIGQHGSDHGSVIFSYWHAEELYKRFVDAYNRGVKRFDRLVAGGMGAGLSGADVLLELERLGNEEMSNEHVLLLHDEDFDEAVGLENARKLENLAVSLAKGVSDDGTGEAERKALAAIRETHAMERMLNRARRKNLRRIVEEYLRKAEPGEWPKIRPFEEQVQDLERRLVLFKKSLEAKLREAGLAGGAEIKVQLLSTTGELIGADGEERVSAAMKAYIREESELSEEASRHSSLQKGYAFGYKAPADEEDDDAASKLKSDILPLINRLLNM